MVVAYISVLLLLLPYILLKLPDPTISGADLIDCISIVAKPRSSPSLSPPTKYDPIGVNGICSIPNAVLVARSDKSLLVSSIRKLVISISAESASIS